MCLHESRGKYGGTLQLPGSVRCAPQGCLQASDGWGKPGRSAENRGAAVPS